MRCRQLGRCSCLRRRWLSAWGRSKACASGASCGQIKGVCERHGRSSLREQREYLQGSFTERVEARSKADACRISEGQIKGLCEEHK
eukprot:3408111-Rhodomonas_salina.1